MSKAAELANLIGNINAGGGGVGRNLFINGAMNVAQRGTSSTGLGTSAGYYTTDRWHIALNSNTAGRFTMTQDSSAPSGFANSTKLACTTADTSIASGEQVIFQQKIEGQNLQTLAKGTSDAKPLALSFYEKGNASATYVAGLYEGDNGRYIASTFNVTTDWTRVEITYPADTTGTLDDDNASSLELWIWLHAGSTYTSGSLQTSWGSSSNSTFAGGLSSSFFDSTDRTFFITGVQLEVGQNPTEFEHEPIERTLLKCERYYQRWQAGQTYDYVCNGSMATDTRFFGMYQLSPDMRDDPTMNFDGTYKVNAQNGDMNASNFNLNRATKMNVAFYCDTSDADRVGNGALFRAGSDADAFIEFISEL